MKSASGPSRQAQESPGFSRGEDVNGRASTGETSEKSEMEEQTLTRDSGVEDKPLGERTAAELVAPLKERAAQAHERARHKVTAEDVLRRQQERAAKRATRATTDGEHKQKRAATARTGLGIALLVATGVTLVLHSVATANASQERAADEALIQELRENAAYFESLVEVAEGEPIDLQAQIQDVASTIEQARLAATEVAALQNRFAALLAADPESSGNGAPSQGFLNAVEHRRTLEPYFAGSTMLLDEAIVYTPTSTFPLASNQIDPRLQWYERALVGGSYTWSVVSATGSEAGDVSKVDIVWLAQDDATGELLAWASGSWSRDVKAFVSLTVGTTAYGDKQSALAQFKGE